MSIIYADYQATTPIDPRVKAKMDPFWSADFGNPHSNHHTVGWRAAEAVRQSQASVARLIGADVDEVIFTSGATEANNLALLGLARRAPATRRRILVSSIEHKCVLAAARILVEQAGFIVDTIPVDHEGAVDLDWLETHLDNSVLVVSIMAVNNEIGTIQNISTIFSLLEEHGVLLHCDAAQAPCATDVSCLAHCADLISMSGHKIYGPQGIGALYIRRDVQDMIEPLLYGGGQQNGLRAGTIPLPLCVGLGAAADIAGSAEQKTERARVGALRDCFVRQLTEELVRAALIGPTGKNRHPGNANLLFHGYNAEDLLSQLQPHLAASTGAACSSGIPESSHVLRAVGLSGVQADGAIRFSFGRFSTEEEINKAVQLTTALLLRMSP